MRSYRVQSVNIPLCGGPRSCGETSCGSFSKNSSFFRAEAHQRVFSLLKNPKQFLLVLFISKQSSTCPGLEAVVAEKSGQFFAPCAPVGELRISVGGRTEPGRLSLSEPLCGCGAGRRRRDDGSTGIRAPRRRRTTVSPSRRPSAIADESARQSV